MRRPRSGDKATQRDPAVDAHWPARVSHEGSRSPDTTPRHRREAPPTAETHCNLRRGEGVHPARGLGLALLEQLHQLVGHGTGELGGIGDV